MLKKMTVLAMAVGVVAALALPASASANWKDHGKDIAGNVEIGLTGNARFQGGLGGVECQVTSTVTFNPGTTGTVNTFVPHPTSDTTNCKGLGGLAFCQIHDVTPIALPWTLHTGNYQTTQLVTHQGPPVVQTTLSNGSQHQNVIVVTNGDITSQATGGFCPVNHINLTGGVVAAIPNQPNTITSVSLTGTLLSHLKTTGGVVDTEDVTVSGTLTIEQAEDKHTYDI